MTISPRQAGPTPLASYRLARGAVLAAVAAAMVGSSAPSPIYGLYAAHYRIDHFGLTAIYAAYSVGTVAALLLLGALSDRLADRRRILYVGLLFVIAGAVLMALAGSVPLLLLGRLLSGTASGCLMGPATAALIELDPARDRMRAGTVMTVAVTAGITAGIILTAILLQLRLAPMVSPFVLLALGSLALIPLLRLAPWAPPDVAPAMLHPSAAAQARPRASSLLREAGLPFLLACGAMMTAWMVGGSFLALGAIFARQLAHIHNAAEAAMTVAIFQIVAGSMQFAARGWPPGRTVPGGVGLTILGLILATLAALTARPWLFYAGALFTGFGYGSIFCGAAALASHSAPPQGRAAFVSYSYIAGYLGNLGLVLGLGAVADRFGLFAAMASLTGGAILLGLSVSLGLWRLRQRPG
ncbi:MFS transporter [Acidisoma sp. C75]